MTRLIIAAPAIALMLGAAPANAQLCSASLSWTAPTENIDGSPLEDLAGYRAYAGTAPRVYTRTFSIDDPSALAFVVGGLDDSTWYFAVTAVNDPGIESAYSNEASKTVANCATLPDPREPGELVAGPDPVMTVYDFVPQIDRAVMLPVGTVTSGTVCIGTQMVVAAGVAYWAVPRALVTWAGNVEPDVVYARCRMP